MLGQSPITNPDPAKARNENASDVDLQVDFANLVNQAKESAQTNAEVVEEARQLLRSGRLVTPESIRLAAQHMLEFGV